MDSAGSIVTDSFTTTTMTSTSDFSIDVANAAAINIGTSTTGSHDTSTINIGTSATARTINVGNAASTKVDLNALAIELESSGTNNEAIKLSTLDGGRLIDNPTTIGTITDGIDYDKYLHIKRHISISNPDNELFMHLKGSINATGINALANLRVYKSDWNFDGTLDSEKHSRFAGREHWHMFYQDSNDNLEFKYISNLGVSTTKAYVDATGTDDVALNFTGQHRSIISNLLDINSMIGLIVSSSGNYINIDGTIKPGINESLPIVSLSSISNDKKTYGVLSNKEDAGDRQYSTGNLVSVYLKIFEGEQRVYINSVGEGGIWVCNKNGNLENGDYITTTTIPGYGGKQTDDLLHNYTVAKITCDCDFSLTKITKQRISYTNGTITKTNISGDTYEQPVKYHIYDNNGLPTYTNDLDSNNNIQEEYKYDTRFVDSTGTIITEEEYLADTTNNYICNFVGCTYHCG